MIRPRPGALLPVTLRIPLAAGSTQVSATTVARGADTAILDAVMLEPLVSRYVLSGGGHATALLRNAATTLRWTAVSLPGSWTGAGGGLRRLGAAGSGQPRAAVGGGRATVTAEVLPGGFTVVRR